MSFFYIFACINIFVILLFIMVKLMSLKTNFKTFKIKMSPFECGFDVNKKSRMPFSSRFFLLAILFLIFDIEIVLLIPMILMNNLTYFSFLSLMIFFIILNLGLFHEWREGSLDWAI